MVVYLLGWLLGVLPRRDQSLSATNRIKLIVEPFLLLHLHRELLLLGPQIFVASPAMCHLMSKTD